MALRISVAPAVALAVWLAGTGCAQTLTVGSSPCGGVPLVVPLSIKGETPPYSVATNLLWATTEVSGGRAFIYGVPNAPQAGNSI